MATEAISEQEWERALVAHLDWGQTWQGDLPADVFFGVWASLAHETEPLVVRVHLGTIPPIITMPPGSPLAVDNNCIVLEDGREPLEFVS